MSHRSSSQQDRIRALGTAEPGIKRNHITLKQDPIPETRIS